MSTRSISITDWAKDIEKNPRDTRDLTFPLLWQNKDQVVAEPFTE